MVLHYLDGQVTVLEIHFHHRSTHRQQGKRLGPSSPVFHSHTTSERFSSEVERPSIDHGSVQSVAQLERRLTTNKTLDIFTMGLKVRRVCITL